MPRSGRIVAVALLATGVMSAVTLEKLALEDMIRRSTEIVRGKVIAISAAKRGSVHYTQATVAVAERFKGGDDKQVIVSIPGGTVNGVRQTFPGTPEVQTGQEYFLFLWTGKSGITQIVGLSQGVLDIKVGDNGEITAARAAIDATVIDPQTGRVTESTAYDVPMTKLRTTIKKVLGAAKE